MKRRRLLLFFLILLCFSTYSHAQNANGIIDPSRAMDWSNVRIPGGVPVRNNICASLTSSATSATINAAIAACANGQVVSLAAGTYTIANGIDFGSHNNVTLRGAGPTQTIVKFTGGVGCLSPLSNGADVCVRLASGLVWISAAVQPGGSHAANWTGGYAQGTTSITLDTIGSAGNALTVGEVLWLDQLDDASDTNGVYTCQVFGACGNDIVGGAGRSGRGQAEAKHVTAITGSGPYTVTITPGLYGTNWRSGQTPAAWWVGPEVTGVGIENLTLDHTASGTTIMSGISFKGCDQCWVKNIRSINANRNAVWCYQDTRLVVRDSYFYGTQNASHLSYAFEGFTCADPLIENNIFQHLPEDTMMDVTMGMVASYNYDTDHDYVNANWQQAGHYAHSVGTLFNLREGNVSDGYTADNIHGTHNQETLFRNYFSGRDGTRTLQTVPILLYTHTRGYNVIGNVLGTSGYHTHYEDSIVNGQTTASEKTIYVLGFCQNVDNIAISDCSVNGTTMFRDSLTQSSLMRWGNYDVVNGAVRWDNAESSPAAVTYINAQSTPSNHNLPASFYLFSQPAWWSTPWGTPQWPAIGPDVTGGTGPGGHVYLIPAQLCYNNTSKDTNGVLNFDASACYASSSAAAPAPPTNLSVSVQ
jgi:hypothetical protein